MDRDARSTALFKRPSDTKTPNANDTGNPATDGPTSAFPPGGNGININPHLVRSNPQAQYATGYMYKAKTPSA